MIVFELVVLSVMCFFFVNFIGKISSASLDYQTVSLAGLGAEAEFASNILYRTLSPVVFLLVAASVLSSIGASGLLAYCWTIVPMQFAFRLAFNVIFTERYHLVRWRLFWLQKGLASGLAYLAHIFLILPGTPLFPNLETIGNELWLVIGFFLFKVLSEVPISDDAESRRLRFIFGRYEDLRARYGSIVSDLSLGLVKEPRLPGESRPF